MRKIDEGTFCLEGNSKSYFVQLYVNQQSKTYFCKVYNKKGVFKKLIYEKLFITTFPDFLSMVHSTLGDIELYNKNQRVQLERFQKYKLK